MFFWASKTRRMSIMRCLSEMPSMMPPQYGRQVADIAAGHRRNKKELSGKNNGEYLSGFLKEDHIRPVITLVIHFGAEEWDGPLSLHEMMSTRDMELLSF